MCLNFFIKLDVFICVCSCLSLTGIPCRISGWAGRIAIITKRTQRRCWLGLNIATLWLFFRQNKRTISTSFPGIRIVLSMLILCWRHTHTHKLNGLKRIAVFMACAIFKWKLKIISGFRMWWRVRCVRLPPTSRRSNPKLNLFTMRASRCTLSLRTMNAKSMDTNCWLQLCPMTDRRMYKTGGRDTHDSKSVDKTIITLSFVSVQCASTEIYIRTFCVCILCFCHYDNKILIIYRTIWMDAEIDAPKLSSFGITKPKSALLDTHTISNSAK